MGGRSSSGNRNTGSNAETTTRQTFSTAESITGFLQGELDKFGLGISKENLAEQVYQAAKTNGVNVAILNSKYLTVENENGTAEFSFTKSKKDGKWKLTPMLAWNDVTKGRHNGVTMYRAAGQWYARKEDAEQAVVKKKLG